MFLANAFIPLSPVAPVVQFLLLLVVIAIEAGVLRHSLGVEVGKALRSRVAAGNFASAAIGLVFAILVVTFVEGPLVYSTRYSEPWWHGVVEVEYRLVLPWTVWFACYQLSWRLEHRILAARRDLPVDPERLRAAVIRGHRITYGLLAVLLAGVILSSWWSRWMR